MSMASEHGALSISVCGLQPIYIFSKNLASEQALGAELSLLLGGAAELPSVEGQGQKHEENHRLSRFGSKS
jgi:hypothetical protein